ncbi:MAG TPA: MATE family efflux transporter [Myxococcaceae bacterium]|jgi:MATE family multidrug resistance protein|nr:MATE family efflux transporter [Myxococcaceae bacterium]
MTAASPIPPRSRDELRILVHLALPLALAQAGQALLGLVDTAVVGRAGAVQLAGAALGNAVVFTMCIVGIGTLMGADPLISQALGARDEVRARRLYWQSLRVALAASAVLLVPTLALAYLLEPLGIAPDVARAARQFVWWRLPGIAAFLVFYAQRGYVQAAGAARALLWATVLANVLNLLGDLLLVFGGARLPAWTGPLRWIPAMGAGGSALATSLVQIIEVLFLAWVIRQVPLPRRPPDLHRRLREDERRILRVGVPIGLHFGAEVGVFALAGFLAGRLGAESLAAHQIALTFSSVTFTFAMGIGNAGSVRVGLAVGARDTPGARRAGLLAFAAGAAFMGVAAITYLLIPGPIVATMTNSPAIAALAIPLFTVAAVFQISDGVQGVGAGVLRGAGDARFTFTANVIGHYLVGLPLALLLGFHLRWGVVGIWWGLAAGLTAVAVALVWRFLRVSRREILPLALPEA